MRSDHRDDTRASGLRRAIQRLDGFPLRPVTARLVLDASEDEHQRSGDAGLASPKGGRGSPIDPGWALLEPGSAGITSPGTRRRTVLVAESVGESGRGAAQTLATCGGREPGGRPAGTRGGDPEPERLARAGLLHGLGLWALAAIDPQRLAVWLAEVDPRTRLDLERGWLGTEVSTLGRQLADRWGSDPLVVDAAWLHADLESGLGACASDPDRLALVQQAYALAEQTPWALRRPEPRDPGTMEPGLRVLVAEVQVRCGPGFVAPDATPHEERLARSNARLRIRLARLERQQAAGDRLLTALAESDAGEGPDAWAERAGKVWCGEPGIVTARVVWTAEADRAVEDPDSRVEGPARQVP
ncbi:MAG: HDOD domain-containing protein, partial [Singulisphaera sp.]